MVSPNLLSGIYHTDFKRDHLRKIKTKHASREASSRGILSLVETEVSLQVDL
jgi:hypothetical protein